MIFLTKSKLEQFLLKNKLPIEDWGSGMQKLLIISLRKS